jgi:uncharacterized membrane protein YdcZ (DUF606 family)
MERGSHWWNEPPLWAWIVMAVGAVALVVMLPLGLNRQAPAAEGDVVATPATSATPAAPAAGSATSVAPSPDEGGPASS